MARTGFQLVGLSPWPLSTSFSVLGIAIGSICFFVDGLSNMTMLVLFSSTFLLTYTLVRWWSDLILESTFLGDYSTYVIRNLRCSIYLFILSEAFFFIGFFWAFFNSSVGELSIQGVGYWPPVGVKSLYPWRAPFLNTVILLSSAITVTWAHKSISVHNHMVCNHMLSNSDMKIFAPRLYRTRVSRKWPFIEVYLSSGFHSVSSKKYQLRGLIALGCTICLGVLFTCVQATEYWYASFTLSDGIYGSTFFMLTGFHGIHVIIGTILLIVAWFRLYFLHFSHLHHYFCLDVAVMYWHFVDIIWIGVFSFVYIWGY
nr:cytochrome c oxidase subunit III [Chamelea striatula]